MEKDNVFFVNDKKLKHGRKNKTFSMLAQILFFLREARVPKRQKITTCFETFICYCFMSSWCITKSLTIIILLIASQFLLCHRMLAKEKNASQVVSDWNVQTLLFIHPTHFLPDEVTQ